MKKGLSILLVAAAIFGFYGSAVNVNDILACKDYWEEAGEKSTADMNKLEDGLNQLKDNEQAYLDGLDQVAEGEKTLAEGEATLAKGEADYAAAPGKLAAARKAIAQGEKDLAAGKKTYNDGKAKLTELKKKLATLVEGFETWKAGYDTIMGMANAASQNHGDVVLLTDGSMTQTQLDAFVDGAEDSASETAHAAVRDAAISSASQGKITKYDSEAAQTPVPKIDPETGQPIGYEAYTWQQAVDKGIAEQGLKFEGHKTIVADGDILAKQGNTTLKEGAAKLEAARGLVGARKLMVSELTKLLGEIGKDEENVKALGGKTVLDQAKLGLNGTDAQFRGTVEMLIVKANELVNQNEKKLAAGKKQLNEGAAKLKSGKAQYRQGLADYAAAPGKLEDGRQQLADGRAQLAAGKDQLAQYEDGEQQVRDGLATLVGTEADLDLESILDRLNGDSDFDNGDDHLDLDEGLNAVEVGRGYQAEDGELITKEIMTRAIATGGLLAAGVLAVLAAILSFTKKNKGAGVCAILAAAAGAFGAYEATQAGSYFSSIAGSTVGQSGMIAAGILGCVALVHAIVHFTAKKEA
jgi:uncharacterized phage infection (PIP) family protein YhgE